MQLNFHLASIHFMKKNIIKSKISKRFFKRIRKITIVRLRRKFTLTPGAHEVFCISLIDCEKVNLPHGCVEQFLYGVVMNKHFSSQRDIERVFPFFLKPAIRSCFMIFAIY